MRKITLKGIDEEFSLAAVNYVDKEQQPNNVINLNFYYWFSKHGKKDIGEPPSVLDSSLVEYSRLQIEKFIQSKGYLKAKVTDSISIKNQKAELIFTAVEGSMFRIRKFNDSIADPKVRQLYRNNRRLYSHIQPGGRFDADSLSFDRDEFYLVMKRNGYFDFYRQYVTFSTDTTFNNSVVDIKMIVANPPKKSSHPVYHINNTEIVIAKSNGNIDTTLRKKLTVTIDSQFTYTDYSGRFKPRSVIDFIFQRKGDIYNIDKQTLTTSRLSELNVFRNVPNPIYTKLPDSTHRLNSKIDIIPLKRMSDRVEGEFLFTNGRYGYNLGNTFTDRNVFKSSAILQVKTNWSVLYNIGSGGVNGVYNQDINLGTTLTYPRLITPFNLPKGGKFGVPHTTFSANYELFFQDSLVKRQSFIAALTYDWAETTDKIHTLTPISIQYSKGTIDSTAREELLALNRRSYVFLIGRTVFTTGSQYAYQLNANKLNTLNDFVYFRGAVDVGGNLLSLLSKAFNTRRDSLGERTFFGEPFSQYAKGEVDLRFYKSLGGERQFVFRINPGIGVPYGNSSSAGLIFEKNFYAGGSNDMRAWLPRTLGPGQFNRATAYPNDSLRAQFKYLDQFGEIKIMTNSEYRYKIADDFFGSKLKGALFMDAGNVWRLHKETSNPNGEFRLDNLWQSTAMGIGTGLRFDLTFFTFRLDAAFKFKDPQFDGSDQWVLVNHLGELFHTGPFKTAYFNANGESYNFMQLNFGIGMPF